MKKMYYYNIRLYFIKFILSLIIEKLHRLVYDKFYLQTYKIKLKDRIIILIYNILYKIYPDFRSYLKHWKPILVRGYNQKRCSVINIYLFFKVRNLNVTRYSPYIYSLGVNKK